ncbi:hypothetical protein [Streptomyces roseus]|uniref:Uncharacterized protein n=1 Tax=Streptomyces roseus TaxID=66430 RepID=A0A0J6XH96_9ACTN|nr:hypothetical protein [Streptomyces roseus]KMO93998.1 hypothetical protein ACS04_31245 [Streptomyces roseus]
MNRYPVTQEPVRQGEAAPSPRPRRAARHRKGPRSRWLVAGLALASVLSATVITATVDPSAPAAVQKPDPRPAR